MFYFFNTFNLKTRIILSVVLLTVAGIAGVAQHVTAILQADVETLVTGQLTTTANYVAADIDGKLNLRLAVLQEIAQSLTRKNLDNPEQAQLLLSWHRASSTLFPSGGGVVDLNGKVVAEFGAVVAGRRGGVIKNIGVYLNAMAGCKTFILPPAPGRFTRTAVVSMAAPICDASGAIIGTVFGVVPLTDHDLFGQLENAGAVAGSYLLLVSRSARLIVSANDKSRILESIADKAALTSRRFQERFEGAGIAFNGKGVQVLSVSRNLQKTDWFVLAAVPTATAFAPVDNLKRQILGATLLLSLILSASLFFLLKKFLAPLDSAGRAMQRMTDGTQPMVVLPIRRNDEIGRLIGHFNTLVIERKATEAKIELIAHHDALTGFPNRPLIQDRFEQAVTYAQRHALKVGLLLLDLDNFKSINDSLGHAVGDQMLKVVAARLSECVRSIDTVSRMGGDEYLLLLRDVKDSAEFSFVLTKITESLARPIIINERELSTSVSVGVSVYPEDGSDFSSLYKKADRAMNQAKEDGKNTCRFFDPLMNVDAVDRLEMRGNLKRAMERGEFELYYQPQIDLHTGAIIGAEALIRWNHPQQGLVLPGKFISIAEDNGLIVPIGEWVLRQACRQAVAWQREGLPALVMAVNLSAVQFKRGNLESTLASALSESGMNPALLELELTESILIKDTENVLQLVKRLKNFGVKLSIDDFGTGYSSLGYLKKFAVDKIKIDQSFVRDLANDPEDAAIVLAIIQMARSLNLRTIAEGVEDEQTLNHLRLHRCDEAQGYYFARALSAGDFARYVARSLANRAKLPPPGGRLALV